MSESEKKMTSEEEKKAEEKENTKVPEEQLDDVTGGGFVRRPSKEVLSKNKNY